MYAACSGGVVGLSSGDVDSCGDVPQYKVMKYLVFGTISTSLLRRICTRSTVFCMRVLSPAASKHNTRMQHAAPCIACGSRGYSGRVLLSDVPSPPHVGLCPTTTESRLRLTRSCARAHTRPESERASEERERRGGGGEKERESEIERAYLFLRASCSSHC